MTTRINLPSMRRPILVIVLDILISILREIHQMQKEWDRQLTRSRQLILKLDAILLCLIPYLIGLILGK